MCHFPQIRLSLHICLVLLIVISPNLCSAWANANLNIALILVLILPGADFGFHNGIISFSILQFLELILARTHTPPVYTYLFAHQLFRQNLYWS